MATFIFGVGFGAMMTAWWLTGRPDREAEAREQAKARRTHPVYRARVPLARLADPRPLPSELRPFPVDTGPLLLVSEAMAAAMAITREVEEMTRAAERKARPWR